MEKQLLEKISKKGIRMVNLTIEGWSPSKCYKGFEERGCFNTKVGSYIEEMEIATGESAILSSY